jgi:hypothetical protein
MHEAVLAEKRVYLDFLVREVSKPGGKETLLKAAPNPDDPSFKLIRDMSEEQLREGLIGAQPLYDKIAAMTQLPSSEVKKAEQRLLADPNLKGPTRTIAQFCLPAIVPITQNEAAHKLRLALLQAAIAVQQQGPEALSNAARQDPLAKAAFRYEKADGGFRLQSKTANPRTGKPIALETGKGLSE